MEKNPMFRKGWLGEDNLCINNNKNCKSKDSNQLTMKIFSDKEKKGVERQLWRLGFDDAANNIFIKEKEQILSAPFANTCHIVYHDNNFYGTEYSFFAKKLKETNTWHIQAIYVLLQMKAYKNLEPHFDFQRSYEHGNYRLPTKAEIEQEIRCQLDISIFHDFVSGWPELEKGLKNLGFDKSKDLILFDHEIDARAYFLTKQKLPFLHGNESDYLDIYFSALPSQGIYTIDKIDLIFYRSLDRQGITVQEPFHTRRFKISEGRLPTKDEIIRHYQLNFWRSGQFEGDSKLLPNKVRTVKGIAQSSRINEIKELFRTPVWPRGPDKGRGPRR